MNVDKFIEDSLIESSQVKLKILENCKEEIAASIQLLTDAFNDGGKLLLCGNGGSAADSQH